jgi:O-antigen/teichoic acid export membrane protein
MSRPWPCWQTLTLGNVLETGDAGSYFFPSVLAGSLYLVALAVADVFMPKLTSAKLKGQP